MTITKNDVKLLASERLTDDPDGGGFQTDVTIIDGVENNLFPDISDLDRAQGANDFRKSFGAILTATTDSYYGGHIILDLLPADPAVSGLLCMSASASEVRSELITRLNADGADGLFYSTKAVLESRAPGDRAVQISSLRVSLIPPSVRGVTVEGKISPVEDSIRLCRPYVLGAYTDQSERIDGEGGVLFRTHPELGTILYDGLSYDQTTLLSNHDGYEYLETLSSAREVLFSGPGFYAGPELQAGVGRYEGAFVPTIAVELALQVQTATFTPSGSGSRAYTLTFLPAEGSESISWVDAASDVHTLVNVGPAEFIPSEHGTAVIDRATGLLVVEFLTLPASGSTVTMRYCKKSEANDVPAPSSWTGSSTVLSIDAGYSLAEAIFNLTGSGMCRVRAVDNTVRKYEVDLTGGVPKLVETDVVGTYNQGTKTLSVVGGGTGAITAWLGVQVIAATSTDIGTFCTAQLPTKIDPLTLTVTGQKSTGVDFSATCDVDGYFSDAYTAGRYNQDTGAITLEFTTNAKLSSLRYEGSQLSSALVSEAIAGVDPAQFDADGKVIAFRSGDISVVHNTQSMSPATVTNGQTVSVGRTRIADARVFGNDGAEIVTGFTFNRAAGTVTFSDVTGYSQPVTITHRVEDVSSIISADLSGVVTLSKPLTHDYPADTSFLSSALVIGDMFSRAHPSFSQATWTDVWSDAIIGTPILADYNEAVNPILVSNSGTLTERWAVIFTNTTAFRVVGEQVGQIAIGATGTDCAPINPSTGEPYFTIEAAGWGTGWATGNVLRFNTTGASAPFWTIRSIQPSEAFVGQDKLAVALRGSIDA